MNGSMSIFPHNALGQAAQLSTDSAAAGEGNAFAEALAATLQASTSTEATPVVPPAEGDPVAVLHHVDVAAKADGSVAIAGVLSLTSAMTSGDVRQPSGRGLTDLMPSVANLITSAVPESRPLAPVGSFTPSAAIAMSDRPAPSDHPAPAGQPSAALVSAGETFVRSQGDATPHILQGNASEKTLGEISTTIAGLNEPESGLPGARDGQLATHLFKPDGRNGDRIVDPTWPTRMETVTSEPGLRQAQFAATAAIARPQTRTVTSESTQPLHSANVDSQGASAKRDPGVPLAGQVNNEPAPPTRDRTPEIPGRTPAAFGARAYLADQVQPSGWSETRPRESGPQGSTILARSVDGQPAQAAAAAGPVLQTVLADAGVRPTVETPGLQPALSIDGVMTDIERFEPATPLGSSRVQAPAASTAPAAQVALQIVQALPGGVDRLSVQLQPAELGNVEIQLTFESAGRMSALITAERPETLELLQRDGRLLERSLGDSGLKLADNGLSFALKQDQQQQQQGQSFHEQAQAQRTALREGRAYDDASDAEQRSPTPRVDQLRLLDIRT